MKLALCLAPIMIVASHLAGAGVRAQAIQQNHEADHGGVLEILAKLDSVVVDTFEKAWRTSGNGTLDSEAVVLIVQKSDGTYDVELAGHTNLFRTSRFPWKASIRAIVHTHPTNMAPAPSKGDIELANQHRVPVITITRHGMYAYDPVSKKVLKLMNGIDWLKPAKWRFNPPTVARNPTATK